MPSLKKSFRCQKVAPKNRLSIANPLAQMTKPWSILLGRYLYRSVIQGKDILTHENGQVTLSLPR